MVMNRLVYMYQYSRWRFTLRALLLHGAVLLLLVVFSFHGMARSAASSATVKQAAAEPVQAVVVDQRAVQKQVNELREAKLKTAQSAKLHRQQQARAAARAKQLRAQEAKRLATLKKQRQRMAKQLEATKAQQAKAAKRLQQTNQVLRDAEAKRAAAAAASAAKLAKQQAVAKASISASQLARYKTMITQKIGQYWLVPSSAQSKKVSCQLLIHVGPGGLVLDATVVRGSGNALLDRSARTAVLKASPLPVPADPVAFDKFRVLRLTVRPEQLA